MNVRVRYAPSPTGLQHIGGVRTALFNFLFAKAHQGQFILRIEDTDQKRFNELALKDLYQSLNFLNIHWDEGPNQIEPYGPYIQSQRFGLYQQYQKQLLDLGQAYLCFCDTQRLDRIRAIQAANKMPPGYDRHCRYLTQQEIQAKLDQGSPYVIRLKVPLQEKLEFVDGILGKSIWDTSAINPDPILIKSDGYPTYHFANIVDDHLMGITHVLRAQEWLPSAPLHIILYRAFGWEPPQFCHLPMVLGTDGQKLSKRHGATAVAEFIEQGYLPEALTNYIALLGWAYDDKREFFSLHELAEVFSIEGLHKAAAIFDYKKLQFFNAHYIQQKTLEQLQSLVLPFFQHCDYSALLETQKDWEQQVYRALPYLQQRMKLLCQAPDLIRFIFIEPEYTIEEIQEIQTNLKEVYASIKFLEDNKSFIENKIEDLDAMKMFFQDYIQQNNLKASQYYMPIRIILTGEKHSFALGECFLMLGIPTSFDRLIKAKKQIEGKL